MRSSTTASPEQQAGVHVLRTSCDACKFRKVKCDRRAKLQEQIDRLAEQNDVLTEEAADDVVCGSCAAYGVRCTFATTSMKKTAPKKPTMKARPNESANARTSPPLSTSSASKVGSLSSRSNSMPISSPATSDHRMADGLLGVEGLTRECLDACTEAYLCYAAHCLAILDIGVYRSRYARAMDQRDEQAELSSAPQGFGDPREAAQPVLMLAVGCVGAGLLDDAIHEDKFALQRRFALRLKEVVDEETRKEMPGLDVIEAVFVISDLQLDVLDNRDSLDAQDLDNTVSSLSSLLQLSPASHVAVVRLALRLSINRRPSPVDLPSGQWRLATGQIISEGEALRRVRIFWAVFAHDTFRALGTRRPPLIGSEDYDYELPVWTERPDSDFDIDFFGHNQTLRVPRLDALHLEAIIKLSYAMRSTIAPMVSMRARSRGIRAEDILRTVSSMQAWKASLPYELSWEYQGHSLFKAMVCEMGLLKTGAPWPKLSRAPPELIGKAIKVLMLEIIYMAQLAGTWTILDEFGVRDEGDVTDMAKTLDQLGISQPQPPAAVTSASTSTSSTLAPNESTSFIALAKPASDTPVKEDNLAQSAKDRLFQVVLSNLFRNTELQTEAAALGILRANRCVFAGLSSAYCILACRWALRRSKQASSSSSSSSSSGFSKNSDGRIDSDLMQYLDPAVLMSHAQRLVSEAIATCDSMADCDKIVMQLQTVIDKTKAAIAANNAGVYPYNHATAADARGAESSGKASNDGELITSPTDGGFLHMRRILRAMDRDEREDALQRRQQEQQVQQQLYSLSQGEQRDAQREMPYQQQQPQQQQQYTLTQQLHTDSLPMDFLTHTPPLDLFSSS